MMRFEKILKDNQLKVTPQRMAILKEIEKIGHTSIEEIYDNIKETYPSISLATIYKNLASMQEAGIIDEVRLPNQKQHYELIKEPHVHLVCEKCGSIVDVPMNNSLKGLRESYEKSTNFKVKTASVAFVGLCSLCQN